MIVGSLLLIVVALGLLVVGLLQGSDALLVASIGASLLAAVALIVGGRQAAAARSARSTARTGRQVPSERYDPLESRLGADGLNLTGEHSSDDLGRRGQGGERRPVGAGARTGTTYGRGGAVPMDETAMLAPVRDEPATPQQGDADHGRYDEYPPAATGYDSNEYAASDYDDDDDDDYDDEDPADEPPIQQSSAADIARVAALDADVLVADGRPRYHVPNCPHLLGRETEPLPAREAIELGFTPCSACAPNDVLLARS